MIQTQRHIVPLTTENVKQLQAELKNNKVNGQASKTEVFQGGKGPLIARSEGDGESVDVTTTNIEQRRTSSFFHEQKRVLPSGLSVNGEIKASGRRQEHQVRQHTFQRDLNDDKHCNTETYQQIIKQRSAKEVTKRKFGDKNEPKVGPGDKGGEKEGGGNSIKQDELENENEEEGAINKVLNKYDNYLTYDSSDEVPYNTDDLNEEYDSADEFREFENELREEMENAETPTESETEEDPTPTTRDIEGDTETIATSQLSSPLPADDRDSANDDDDDDDDQSTTEEEQPEEEEDIDYEYMTSPMETEQSIFDDQTEEESTSQGDDDSQYENPVQRAIAMILNEKEDQNDSQNIDEDINDDVEQVYENKSQETRPGTRIICGQSTSPHIELHVEVESAACSDRFDEFEGKIFDQEDLNFSTPCLFVKNDEREENPNTINTDNNKCKSRKMRKKRKQRKKQITKLKNSKNSPSDSENEQNDKFKKVKFNKKLKGCSDKDRISSSTSVEPMDTAYSSSSGDEWTISSSETASESSYIESNYQSSYSPASPSPITTKFCWPIDGKLRNLPPIKKKFQTHPEKQGTNKAKKTKKTLSASTKSPKTDDNSTMVKKILSANRNKITKLYNVVEELQLEVDNLRQENTTLKRISVKQERELKRVDREEGSLPQLLQRHSAELRSYRERLKKNKQDILQKEKESHSHDLELAKLRDKLQHFKQLDNNKKLEERATLTKKLERVEKLLADRDTKILELQKTIKLSEKARQREIKDHQDRYRKAKEELVRVQESLLSLTEKLREKEKQLDMTNIYHQNVQRKLKKVNPLALPPAYVANTKNDMPSNQSQTDQKKIANVFLTNDASDSSSIITAETRKSKDKTDNLSALGNYTRINDDKNLEIEKQQAQRLKDELEREQRRKEEEEGKRKLEEAIKNEEEQRRKIEDEALNEKIRKLEEEKQKKERESAECERKKREEEERLRKEEEAKLKFKEDEELRRKKDLLLARMKAIDAGQDKQSGIIDMELSPKGRDDEAKKVPIFLQSSEKPKDTTNEPRVFADSEKQKFGSSSSVRSKHSKESYDVKESFQNLHHGLPAHPSDQHFKARRNSQDDFIVFGSYKPTVGQQKESNGKPDSFDEPSKSSGLDFVKKQANKQGKSNDVIFGSYQPTFSGSSKTSYSLTKDNDSAGTLDLSSKRMGGRRAKTKQPSSIFGEDLFNENKPKQSSVFDDESFRSSNKLKDKNYPWENKIAISSERDDESLLPRRSKLNQGLNQGPQKQVPAVGNMLNGTLEDDIEEVTL